MTDQQRVLTLLRMRYRVEEIAAILGVDQEDVLAAKNEGTALPAGGGAFDPTGFEEIERVIDEEFTPNEERPVFANYIVGVSGGEGNMGTVDLMVNGDRVGRLSLDLWATPEGDFLTVESTLSAIIPAGATVELVSGGVAGGYLVSAFETVL